MKALYLFGLSVLTMATQVQAGDIRDQMNIQTGKAELVVPDMPPQQVTEQIKDALTQFAIPANLNFHPLPSPIPASLASPQKNSWFSMVSQRPTMYVTVPMKAILTVFSEAEEQG